MRKKRTHEAMAKQIPKTYWVVPHSIAFAGKTIRCYRYPRRDEKENAVDLVGNILKDLPHFVAHCSLITSKEHAPIRTTRHTFENMSADTRDLKNMNLQIVFFAPGLDDVIVNKAGYPDPDFSEVLA
jgi:hypothetical protein